MQLKKIQTGVVYAAHRSSEYDKDRGVPVVVLDADMWRYSAYDQALTRAPGSRAGVSGGYRSNITGLPVLRLYGFSHVEVTPATCDALVAAARWVAEDLRRHVDRKPFAPDLPEDDETRRYRFEVLNPREIQAEWDTYVTERAAAKEAAEEARERHAEEARRHGERIQAAHDRLKAVLPQHPVLAQGTSGPRLTWPELAALLDAYADAPP